MTRRDWFLGLLAAPLLRLRPKKNQRPPTPDDLECQVRRYNVGEEFIGDDGKVYRRLIEQEMPIAYINGRWRHQPGICSRCG